MNLVCVFWVLDLERPEEKTSVDGVAEVDGGVEGDAVVLGSRVLAPIFLGRISPCPGGLGLLLG